MIATMLLLPLILLSPPPAGFDARPILDALRYVETGSCKDPANAVGDNGNALGPYQIHYVYWVDSGVRGSYEQVKDKAYAEKVILAYWARYAPNWNYQTLARIHNGGPKGHKKDATKGYWDKVEARLKE